MPKFSRPLAKPAKCHFSYNICNALCNPLHCSTSHAANTVNKQNTQGWVKQMNKRTLLSTGRLDSTSNNPAKPTFCNRQQNTLFTNNIFTYTGGQSDTYQQQVSVVLTLTVTINYNTYIHGSNTISSNIQPLSIMYTRLMLFLNTILLSGRHLTCVTFVECNRFNAASLNVYSVWEPDENTMPLISLEQLKTLLLWG